MLTKELLMMSRRRNDIVSSARFFTLKLPLPILAYCPESLWILLLWRYSRPAWTRSCAACCG